MSNKSIDLTIRIAPKEGCDYWRVQDWQRAKIAKDWDIMIQIFKDRMEYRYFKALQALIEADEHQHTRRFGFPIVALDCLLLETLHQFYKGYRESKGNGKKLESQVRKIGERGSNGQFFCEFLMQSSFVFKSHFESQTGAAIIFYQDIRCGLLHSGETLQSTLIRIHKSNEDLSELFRMVGNEDGIILYRDTLNKLLEDEFREYCGRLSDEQQKDLRKSFIKKMGYICGYDYGDGGLE